MNQAHRIEPESRVHWWLGAVAEIGVLVFVVAVILLMSGLQS